MCIYAIFALSNSRTVTPFPPLPFAQYEIPFPFVGSAHRNFAGGGEGGRGKADAAPAAPIPMAKSALTTPIAAQTRYLIFKVASRSVDCQDAAQELPCSVIAADILIGAASVPLGGR
jgi:hypothetical protein